MTFWHKSFLLYHWAFYIISSLNFGQAGMGGSWNNDCFYFVKWCWCFKIKIVQNVRPNTYEKSYFSFKLRQNQKENMKVTKPPQKRERHINPVWVCVCPLYLYLTYFAFLSILLRLPLNMDALSSLCKAIKLLCTYTGFLFLFFEVDKHSVRWCSFSFVSTDWPIPDSGISSNMLWLNNQRFTDFYFLWLTNHRFADVPCQKFETLAISSKFKHNQWRQ